MENQKRNLLEEDIKMNSKIILEITEILERINDVLKVVYEHIKEQTKLNKDIEKRLAKLERKI